MAGVLFCILLTAAGRPANHTVRAELPPLLAINPTHNLDPLRLKPSARHAVNLVCENSALEKCSKLPDTFWTLNDSANGAFLFAIKQDGRVIVPEHAAKNYRGILLKGRRNIDWEAVASDGNGNLIIADIGNNLSNRRNLCFYIVPEPSPFDVETASSRKVSFYYPTQDAFPDPQKNFDAESCFALNGFIYFFSKQWTTTETVLWRVDPTTERYQAAVPVARFNVRGLVTDAALSPSRNRLAVLTYHCIWLFELPPKNAKGVRDEKRFLAGTPRYRKIVLPVDDWQAEGIAFTDENTLVITSESGGIFTVPVSEIR